MRKFFKIIFVIVVIIGLIYLANVLGILDFSVFYLEYEKIDDYSEYYYTKLDLDGKRMYIRIDEALKHKNRSVFLGVYDDKELGEKIKNVLESYFYDNPDYYYISSEYTIEIKDFKILKALTVHFDYILRDDYEIDKYNIELEKAIDKILQENIQEGMTDFEKELAIHDALVQHISYYKYEDITKIPNIKHTAYGALVEKEAVCDGYAKAFKILLEKVGIDSVIVNGTVENVAHAWNMVKLEDEYYHVDVTSDKLEENSNKYVIHRYFNVLDNDILKTHTLTKMLEVPKSSSTKSDYYFQKGYYINYEDNLKNRLKEIVKNQTDFNILEVKVDQNYSSKDIIDTLYDLNFNNWRSNRKTNISYSNMLDVYIFIK